MEGWDQRERVHRSCDCVSVCSICSNVTKSQCHTKSPDIAWGLLHSQTLFLHLCEVLSRIWLVWTNDHLWSKISLPAKESKINIIATRNEQSRQNRRPCHVSGSRESRLVLDKGKREEKVNLLDFFTSELSWSTVSSCEYTQLCSQFIVNICRLWTLLCSQKDPGWGTLS